MPSAIAIVNGHGHGACMKVAVVGLAGRKNENSASPHAVFLVNLNRVIVFSRNSRMSVRRSIGAFRLSSNSQVPGGGNSNQYSRDARARSMQKQASKMMKDGESL